MTDTPAGLQESKRLAGSKAKSGAKRSSSVPDVRDRVRIADGGRRSESVNLAVDVFDRCMFGFGRFGFFLG